MSPVSGLAEVVLWAHDIDRSLAFYGDLLGLEVISPPGMANRFLRAGAAGEGIPSMVVLIQHPDPGGSFPGEKRLRPLHHLALSVAPPGYEDLVSRLRGAAVEIRDGTHPVLEGVRTFYVDDPDGNEVEIISPSG
ncbi:MAG: VOC family protein [Candidatus Dormibacteraceae bacterium]